MGAPVGALAVADIFRLAVVALMWFGGTYSVMATWPPRPSWRGPRPIGATPSATASDIVVDHVAMAWAGGELSEGEQLARVRIVQAWWDSEVAKVAAGPPAASLSPFGAALWAVWALLYVEQNDNQAAAVALWRAHVRAHVNLSCATFTAALWLTCALLLR